MEMNMKKGELIFVLFLRMAVSILLFVSRGYYSLAKQFPQLVGGVTLIFLLWDLAVGFWKRKKEKDSGEAPEKKPGPSAFVKKRWLVLGICLTVYVLLMPTFGFLLMTALLISSLLWFFDVRKPLTIVIYTVVTVGIIYGVFAKLLYVPLPTGTIW